MTIVLKKRFSGSVTAKTPGVIFTAICLSLGLLSVAQYTNAAVLLPTTSAALTETFNPDCVSSSNHTVWFNPSGDFICGTFDSCNYANRLPSDLGITTAGTYTAVEYADGFDYQTNVESSCDPFTLAQAEAASAGFVAEQAKTFTDAPAPQDNIVLSTEGVNAGTNVLALWALVALVAGFLTYKAITL